MGAPKGTDNFSEYREAQVNRNLRVIEDALGILRKRKLKFKGLQLLAAEVAERTGVHRTTLCRNPTYKRLLLNHLASQPGASALVGDDEATPELLKAKLFDVRLENKTIRSRLAAMEQKLTAPAVELIDEGQVVPSGKANLHVDFSNTVMVLKLVLERVNAEFEIIQVDFENEEMRDLSSPAGRQVIASGQRARAFLQAYRTLLEQEGKLGKKT